MTEAQPADNEFTTGADQPTVTAQSPDSGSPVSRALVNPWSHPNPLIHSSGSAPSPDQPPDRRPFHPELVRSGSAWAMYHPCDQSLLYSFIPWKHPKKLHSGTQMHRQIIDKSFT